MANTIDVVDDDADDDEEVEVVVVMEEDDKADLGVRSDSDVANAADERRK